jgi:pimeloyl-ACP methyl ester carboxylesterase
MIRVLLPLLAVLFASTASAQVPPYPVGFKVQDMKTNGTTLHVRIGGQGPAVVLLHGFGDTGDMWAPLAANLARDHFVIVPDLRGMGLSAHPPAGYDKKNQGRDIAGLLDALNVQDTEVVAHDIGNMVAYAFTAQFPARVTKIVFMDAPLPGVGPWEKFLLNPSVWHFGFRGPDMERLVAGRERIYLDRFWNELSADPRKIDEETREHYAALYAKPGAMHSAFEQFGAFAQDAKDNQAFAAKGKLPMPVLAIGADHSMGELMEIFARAVFTNVTGQIITNSGHWLMEEQPQVVVSTIRAFLDRT